MNLNYFNLKDKILSKNYAFFDDKAFNVNLFGIRSASVKVDEFNDKMGVAYRDAFNNPIVLLFAATTKPGLYYLKNKLGDDQGTAILIPGQYRSCWQLGHHGGYEALTQINNGVFKVWRDKDSDGDLDTTGTIYNDVTGLNGHTTSFIRDVERVGQYSAGCQVIQNDLDFTVFLSLVKISAQEYGSTFSYTLLEEHDFN